MFAGARLMKTDNFLSGLDQVGLRKGKDPDSQQLRKEINPVMLKPK
jgi:hypothetical protein